MATITNLYKVKEQPPAVVNGQVITATESWIMDVNTRSISPIAATSLLLGVGEGNSYGWLRVGKDGHTDNDSVKVIDVDVERNPERDDQFIITTSLTNEKDAVNKSQSPTRASTYYSYQNVDTIVEVDVDPITGNAIAASNGEGYYPKAKRKGTLKRIIISRNERTYNEDRANNYEQKLNKDVIRINGRSYAARSVLLESWTGDNDFDNEGNEFWKVKYSVLTDPKGLHKVDLIDAASGPDLNGVHPQSVSWGGSVPVKPYKLGRNAANDGLYMTRADQQDATKYFSNQFNLHEEIAMNSVLRL